MLAHGVVGGGFDDDLGAGGDQLVHPEHEGHAELASERFAPGIFVAAGDRHHLGAAHLAAARVL